MDRRWQPPDYRRGSGTQTAKEINSFHAVFPNLDPSLAQSFAALMYACYAAVILSGIVSSRLQQLEKQG